MVGIGCPEDAHVYDKLHATFLIIFSIVLKSSLNWKSRLIRMLNSSNKHLWGDDDDDDEDKK